MKDIKQYFSNGKRIDGGAAGIDNVVERKEERQKETIATDKRKRVKIRISRNTSKERTCDIIESKNDMIDKTPSPYNGKVKNGEKAMHDETPKVKSKRNLKKGPKFASEINGNDSEKTKNIVQDKTELSKEIIIDSDNSPNNNIKNMNEIENALNELCNDEIGSQREESNAFQVLMNRSKPIQYKLLPQESVENIECKEKLDDIKQLKSKHKEKLIALADKKGYSKRKIVEVEEGERIEKRIENRMRFFKNDVTDDVTHKKDDSIGLSLKNKQQSGNLLNYFSKSPLGSTNKDEKYASTFIVKADVHRTDNSDIEPVIKSISNKIYSSKKCSKSELNLSTADDIHLIASENLYLTQTAKQGIQKREKPRWALRIKLHSFEDNDSLNETVVTTSDDEIFSPRSKSKFSASSKFRNFANTEDNRVHPKDYNSHIKTKIRKKEKKESVDKQKEDNVQNTAKDTIINNNKDADTQVEKSNDQIAKAEQNDANEIIITTIDNSECEITHENVQKRKTNEKLAPLFIKRRKTNPIVTAARRSFLQSDIIDEIMENKSTDKANSNNYISTLPFPAISHVPQLEEASDSIRVELKYKFPTKVERKYLPSIDVNNYKCICNYNKTPTAVEVKSNKPVKENLDQILSEIEKLCPDARKIWKTISTIKGDSEKKSLPRTKGRKLRTLERKKMLIENEESLFSHDCAWTCKYKPMSAEEIVGNEEAAGKLKDWLSSWSESLTKEDDNSSGDEFYSSDCSSSCNNRENKQIAVLLGPHGSGKTASVYAVAEELGYSVLEVNASSRRTGKKILKELEEATKSHRIKKNKTQHKSPFERIANETEAPKITQNSLILLEDIDLIFEEDEGFVSAAYQLALNTKRPIVMTCRDTCPHLGKMAPQQNKIYFQRVSGSRVSALLELISLTETNHRLSHNCLTKLLQAGDLRQALLQSQYLLLSGPPVLSEQSTTVKPSLWQNMQHNLYKPAIKLTNRHKTRKGTNTKRSNDTMCVLNNLAENLDSLSLVSSLIDIEDTVLNISEKKAQPNLSLAESISFYSASRDLQADIATFISDRILYNDLNANEHAKNQSNIILKKRLNRGVDLALSHVTSTCLDQRIMALDYLPTVRTICRAEEIRSTINCKRSNRFFHYLNNLNVPTISMKPNILAAACKMLQERENKTVSATNG